MSAAIFRLDPNLSIIASSGPPHGAGKLEITFYCSACKIDRVFNDEGTVFLASCPLCGDVRRYQLVRLP